MDADVRLAPDALARLLSSMESSGTGLVSGFPKEETRSLGEALIVPVIHLILLGYLPLPGLKWTRHPAFAAACGQLKSESVRIPGWKKRGETKESHARP